MTWNQIESKWAAMARRVRADWRGSAHNDAMQPAIQRENRVTGTDFGLVVSADKPQETSTASTE